MGRNVSTDDGSVGGSGNFLGVYEQVNMNTSNSYGNYVYNPPEGTKSLLIYIAGGGGGGGGGTNDYNAGGGGGAGGVGVKLVSSNIAAAYYITLGYGGAGGSKGNSGSAGQSSEIHIGTNNSGTLLMRVPGATGGGRASGGSDPLRGGESVDQTSGTWQGCNFVIPGGDGGPSGGGYSSDNAQSGGHGGGNFFGKHGGPCAERFNNDSRPGHRVVNAGCGGGGGQQMQSNAGDDCQGARGTGGGVLIYAYG